MIVVLTSSLWFSGRATKFPPSPLSPTGPNRFSLRLTLESIFASWFGGLYLALFTQVFTFSSCKVSDPSPL